MPLANVALPLWALGIPFFFFIAIVLIEAFVFWILIGRVFKVAIKFHRALLSIFVANIITSFLGVLTVSDGYRGDAVMWIVAYFLTVFIEWMVYVPFFQKEDVKKFDLLKISFIVNIISYLIIITLLLYRGL